MSFSPAKRTWFSRLNPFTRRLQQSPSRHPAPTRSSFRPTLETLEDRTLLSTTLISNPTSYPASAVVQLLSTFPNGQQEQGTGTMVNQNTVLTAGHMVYNYSDGGFAKSIQVVAGRYGNNAPYGVAYMTYEQTFNSFIADDKINSDAHDPGDGDIGFISLNSDLGDLTGWLGFMAASGTNYNVNKYGYPGTDGYNGTQMVYDFGALNENAAGTNGFAYWGWSTSSMSSIPGESGSSLILDLNGKVGIIGVQDLGPTSGSGEGYAEVTTQSVINSLTAFESAHPAVGEAGYLGQVGTPPSLVVAGGTFGLTIAAEDGNGNILSTYNGTVYLSIFSGPNGASLGGTFSANAVNGVAHFYNLYLNTPGTYTLLATSSDMKSVITETITVEPSSPPPNNNPPSNNPPTYNPPSNNPPTYNPPSNNPSTYNPPSNNPPTYNPPSNNPSPQPPSPFDEAATDARTVAQGLLSGNIAEAIDAFEGFVSLYFQSSGAQQQQLLQVFINDLIADY